MGIAIPQINGWDLNVFAKALGTNGLKYPIKFIFLRMRGNLVRLDL